MRRVNRWMAARELTLALAKKSRNARQEADWDGLTIEGGKRDDCLSRHRPVFRSDLGCQIKFRQATAEAADKASE